jgi:hypothetical protein
MRKIDRDVEKYESQPGRDHRGIADAVRWAEQIMPAMDERWPVTEHRIELTIPRNSHGQERADKSQGKSLPNSRLSL